MKKPNKNYHTSNAKTGTSDYYGTGIRQPLGKMRDNSFSMVSLTPKQLKTPPKKLA